MAAAVGRAPLHCTAVGKVLLAFQPEEYVKQLIDRGLATYTSKTPTRRETTPHARGAKARGHAIDDEERKVACAPSRRRCATTPGR